jgi:Ca2+ transporting ATPase
MAKKNAIVRTLPSVETLGCCTVICSDKTGTLTTNKMVVRKVFTFGKTGTSTSEYDVSGPPDFSPEGELEGVAYGDESLHALQMVAKISAVANDSKLNYNGSTGVYEKIGESTEAALRVLAEKIGAGGTSKPSAEGLASAASDAFMAGSKTTATYEFSRDRKSMSRLLNKDELYVKGAPELLLGRCNRALTAAGKVVKLDAPKRKVIAAMLESYAAQALRVLALAYDDSKDGGACGPNEDIQQYESGLIFAGLAGMLDPPRDEVKDSMLTCKKAGIRVIVITGDNQTTAESICTKISVFDEGEDLSGRSFIGKEFMEMSESEKNSAVMTANLFARVEPAHKEEIVRLLQRNNQVVAMTGDGVNDAPALKKANIGVAMGITGTDVAKGAADMILADDNFATIVTAVEEGRIMYINTKQFIRFLVSSNIGEVVSIFLAAALGLPEGFVPVQLLWVNLVTDGPPATALGWNPTDDDIMRRPPRKSKDAIIDGFQFIRYLIIGMYVGVATVVGFCWYYMYYSQGPHLSYSQIASFHSCDESWGVGDCDLLFKQGPDGHWAGAATMSLTILVVIEMFNALNSVSESQSILVVSPFQNMYLIGAVLMSIILHAVILYVPAANPIFYVKPLDYESWVMVLQICAPVCLLDEFFKFYARLTEAKNVVSSSKKDQ